MCLDKTFEDFGNALDTMRTDDNKSKFPSSTDSKLVVWDVDDVVWDLQGRVAKCLDIPFQNLIEFHILENELLTMEQRQAINAFYRERRCYESIEFYAKFEKIMDLEDYGARLQFNSNQFSAEGARNKKAQIVAKVPGVRDEMFNFNVVDGHTTIQKKFPGDSFIVIDDSPYNIALSPAPHNIMPILPWTQTARARAQVASRKVYYVPQGDLEAIYRLVRQLLTS